MEESAELGTLLGGVGREVGGRVGLAVEEVGDVDLVAGTFVVIGKEVGTLCDRVGG